jgi:ABC-2 type transport system ATP-binding protein
MSPVVEVAGICKRFGAQTAVSGLSFHAERGEIFGIVGPDGAGKSTLLRIISAILRPDEGMVRIDGVDAFRNPYRIKENLAYMPQRFGLYEDLTVEENLYFFGRLFGVSKKDAAVRLKTLYEFSRLEPFKNRLAGKLSGGMKQKLGLACSLVHSPGLILLDEPTNGVDPVSRREFWKILYDLMGGGVTIIVSTSYLDEAERCNRVALMYEGRFIRTGTPGEIKNGIGKKFMEIGTDNPRLGEIALKESAEFRSITLTGRNLRVFVDDPAAAEKSAHEILGAKGIAVLSVRNTLPTLEDCYMDIISTGGAG